MRKIAKVFFLLMILCEAAFADCFHDKTLEVFDETGNAPRLIGTAVFHEVAANLMRMELQLKEDLSGKNMSAYKFVTGTYELKLTDLRYDGTILLDITNLESGEPAIFSKIDKSKPEGQFDAYCISGASVYFYSWGGHDGIMSFRETP